MNQEFAIQCGNCGTLYTPQEEACPYCGEPSPYYDEGLYLEPGMELFPDEFADDYPEYYEDDDFYDPDDPFYDDEAYEDYEAEAEPSRFTFRRLSLGCLGLIVCGVLFYGSMGLLGAYHGWQEKVAQTQAQVQTHYERGQKHLEDEALELAIAEFEAALSLDPNFLPARQALREAERQILIQPSPTSQTRLAAAASLLETAASHLDQENWAEAALALAQVRDLNPDYEPEQVSEALYTANYQLGLQLSTPDQIEDAIIAFERALAEREDDPSVLAELTKATLYRDGRRAERQDKRKAIEAFSKLYHEDPDYLDTKQHLFRAYETLGDDLLAQEEWCQAKEQYIEASLLQPNEALQTKISVTDEKCSQAPLARATAPPPAAASPEAQTTLTATETTTATQFTPPGNGRLIYSTFNINEDRWDIVSVPAGGGTPEVIVTDGTMPALSPNGQLLIYHAQLIEAEGFHVFNRTTGQDQRITLYRRHILPRWGGNNLEFVFTAQELATDRWQIYLGFADGKSEPVIVRDGRTPDLAPDNNRLVYQGTDPEGNNPGLYLTALDGGEATRLTTHQSDRSPDFSPDGSQIAYMSTQGGNWDIYTIPVAGGEPRRVTETTGSSGLPAWSPDGSQIAYVSDADGSWAIYTINAGGGAPHKVIEWDGARQADWLLAQIDWASNAKFEIVR